MSTAIESSSPVSAGDDEKKFEYLMADVCDTTYACGEWTNDEDEPYGDVLDRAIAAQRALMQYVDSLHAALSTATARADETEAVRTERNLLASRCAALQQAVGDLSARAERAEEALAQMTDLHARHCGMAACDELAARSASA